MGRKRPIRVQFCMSESEKTLLDEKTELSGLSKRAVLMLALQDVPIVGSEMLSELKQINLQFSEQYRLLKNMANNLNQIAKICNRFFYMPDALELTKLDEDLCDCRKEMMKGWESLKLWLRKLEQTGKA